MCVPAPCASRYAPAMCCASGTTSRNESELRLLLPLPSLPFPPPLSPPPGSTSLSSGAEGGACSQEWREGVIHTYEVCVCVWEREREKKTEGVYVYVSEWDRGKCTKYCFYLHVNPVPMCVCMCICMCKVVLKLMFLCVHVCESACVNLSMTEQEKNTKAPPLIVMIYILWKSLIHTPNVFRISPPLSHSLAYYFPCCWMIRAGALPPIQECHLAESARPSAGHTLGEQRAVKVSSKRKKMLPFGFNVKALYLSLQHTYTNTHTNLLRFFSGKSY